MEGISTSNLRHFHKLIVRSLPSFISLFTSYRRSTQILENNAVLADGTPYSAYRYFLYSDGFDELNPMSDTASAGIGYVNPL